MKNALILLACAVAILLILFAGLLPLPDQQDNPSPHTEPAPAGQSPEPTLPKGPSTREHSEPGK